MAADISMEPDSGPKRASPGARSALILLIAINLFNYIDRQVLSAVLPRLEIDASLFSPSDPYLKTKLSLLSMGFMVSYMLLAPLFGYLGDRSGRWKLIGIGVIIWSLASGASGLSTTFVVLLLTRCLVGAGEAAYGPVAPSMLSDLYPVRDRGKILSLFYMAIPVGSALGFVIGGLVGAAYGWRTAFLVVMVPGLILGAICFFHREPPRTNVTKSSVSYRETIARVLKVKSWLYCTLGMVCSTFMLGGIAIWTPYYVFEREARFAVTTEAVAGIEKLRDSNDNPIVDPDVIARLTAIVDPADRTKLEIKPLLARTLTEAQLEQYGEKVYDGLATKDSPTVGGISTIFGGMVVILGLLATLVGGWLGDRLRNRGYAGAYFKVAGWFALLSFPFFVAMTYAPFPLAWVFFGIAIFGLFANTGPANTILANVVPSSVRATAFALNIFVIHAFGDAVSPTIIGFVADLIDLPTAIRLVSLMILGAGVLWLMGAKHLDADTHNATAEDLAGRA